MKRIVSLILALALSACAMLSLASCGESFDVYTVANESKATTVITQVNIKDKDGNDLEQIFDVKSAGNDAIIEYKFKRLVGIDEAAETGLPRVYEENGKIYYIDGKYYNSGEGENPWTGSPSETLYKFSINKAKLIEPTVSEDGLSFSATMTPENCQEMFNFGHTASESVEIKVETNGVNLTRVYISYYTVDGATVSMTSSYSYNVLELDFSEIIGEEEDEEIG